MKTRMEKYYDNTDVVGSRAAKNEELYKEISHSEFESFEINSNAKVIANSGNNIDVEKIKKILDTRYNDVPKRRSITLDQEEEETNISLDQTREYDINAILEQARNKKDDNYEKDRLKKVHDTQLDILKNLNLDTQKEEEENEKDDLMTLIDAVNKNDNKNHDELDPLDILTDLKGSENTVTLSGLKEEVDSALNDTTDVNLITEKKNHDAGDTDSKIDNSFYTASVNFTQSDFDDFEDLKKEVNSNKMLTKVIIAFIIVIVLAVIVFLLISKMGLI